VALRGEDEAGVGHLVELDQQPIGPWLGHVRKIEKEKKMGCQGNWAEGKFRLAKKIQMLLKYFCCRIEFESKV
jgi:hypothetical protein